MTDTKIIKALDILDKFDFFGGQRAGRELWFDKPTEIQNKDIENFSKDIAFLKDFIKRQQAEIEKLTALNGVNETCSARKQETIERLEIELKAMRAAANGYKAEVEKLHPYKLHYGNLRMEIAREVCDRLKAKGTMIFGGAIVVFDNNIDDLIKEMEKEDGTGSR